MIIAVVVLGVLVVILLALLQTLEKTVRKNYDVLNSIIVSDQVKILHAVGDIIIIREQIESHALYLDSLATDVTELTLGLQILVEKIVELREEPEQEISDTQLRLQAALAARQQELA